MIYTIVIGISIITAVTVLFIKQFRPDYALLVTAAAGIVIMLIIISVFTDLLDDISELFEKTGVDSGVFSIVLKSLGICYITSFSADLCKDFGQTSLSGKVELAGKITILIITMPLIKQILESALELI